MCHRLYIACVPLLSLLLASVAAAEYRFNDLDVIRDLDGEPKQVLISATILEAGLGKEIRQLGFDLGDLSTPASETPIATANENGLVVFQGSSILGDTPIVAYREIEDFTTIAQPSIVVSDGNTAEVFVPQTGEQPFFASLLKRADKLVVNEPAGTAFLAGVVVTFDQANQHRQVPLLSKIPIVNDLFNQTDAFDETINGQITKPNVAFLNETTVLSTTVRLLDGQTVVIAGLIDGQQQGEAMTFPAVEPGQTILGDPDLVVASDKAIVQYIPVFDTNLGQSDVRAVSYGLQDGKSPAHGLTLDGAPVIEADGIRLYLRPKAAAEEDGRQSDTASSPAGQQAFDAYHLPHVATIIRQQRLGGGDDIGVFLSDGYGSQVSFRYGVSEDDSQIKLEARIVEVDNGQAIGMWLQPDIADDLPQLRNINVSPTLAQVAGLLEQSQTLGDDHVLKKRGNERVILNDDVISHFPLNTQFSGDFEVIHDPNEPANLVNSLQGQTGQVTRKLTSTLWNLQGEGDRLKITTDTRFNVRPEGDDPNSVELNLTVRLINPFDNNDTQEVSKVPLLGDLPVLGQVFQTNKWEQNRESVLIFITPIINEPLEGQTIADNDEPTLLQRWLAGEPMTTAFEIEMLSDQPIELLYDDLVVTVEVVPEPTSAALLLPLLGMMLRRRR